MPASNGIDDHCGDLRRLRQHDYVAGGDSSGCCSNFLCLVAATQRAIALEDGPVLLVGHSYGGAVITEPGNDTKVAGLVYVSAVAPDHAETTLGLISSVATPIGSELRPDKSGFLKLTPKGVAEDFAQDLSAKEIEVLTATQVPVSVAANEGRGYDSGVEVETVLVRHRRK